MKEIWKEILSADHVYFVSNIGRVKSFARYSEGKLLKPTLSKKGYYYINLGRGIKNRFFIHTLVLTAFVGERPVNAVVNHKNGIKTDNFLDNLEWVSYSENNKHAFQMGLNKFNPYFGTEHPQAKFSSNDIKMILEMRKQNISVKQIAEKCNVHICTIYHLIKGRTYYKNGKDTI